VALEYYACAQDQATWNSQVGAHVVDPDKAILSSAAQTMARATGFQQTPTNGA